MTDFKHHRFPLSLASILLIAATLALASELPLASPLGSLLRAQAAAPQPDVRYEVRAVHDLNGTGKFYMGREIAQVMGAGGIEWLDRAERAEQEQPEVVINAMGLHDGDVVADLGAGSGYFTFRLAAKVGSTGKALAVDIQDEMLETVRQRAAASGISNVEEVKASETDPHLPAGGVDLVLMVDVYHELAYPYEVMTKVRDALKPGGRVVFVEYRKEDPSVPIKEVHKMSVEQLTKEMNAVRLARVKTVETLPSQHIVIFETRD
jgi:ubiquinone/menaquinone biosynthesis C-methylase UbiE